MSGRIKIFILVLFKINENAEKFKTMVFFVLADNRHLHIL